MYIYMSVLGFWSLSVLCVLCVFDIKSEFQYKTTLCVRLW